MTGLLVLTICSKRPVADAEQHGLSGGNAAIAVCCVWNMNDCSLPQSFSRSGDTLSRKLWSIHSQIALLSEIPAVSNASLLLNSAL